MREILYGRNVVYESLRAGRRQHHRLLISENVRRTDVIDQITFLARQAGVPIISADRSNLQRIGDVNHQGVMLETSEYPYRSLDEILALTGSGNASPFLLLLDLLQDPHNVGSLLRTAEAVGVHGVVLQRRRAVGITPAVIRASSGAAEHLLVAQVTNLVDVVGWLQAHDVWVAGVESVRDARLYYEADLTGPLALVVGSEGKGLRRLVRQRCDYVVRLPMKGQVTSLNASVAGSIALYEALRQREKHALGQK